ncbi:excinuclease ABC subunit B [Metamycoplasma cloacale]|uniref:Excinuclease ABC subunit UvrB n=1 Tax=Metamycoplasma cloacale TaxID=92401 RepID=A0A2Z4LLC8_9BACT|nr:excinuclease ABC subunit UvrB [Metamycoplasma cloacale]AWX42561.1 excinuclease ABC subunit UvrB [Metamycoplasma cloacale]VEU79746.1 excinuclease ABC subunit B [Metamycoplasma cloacale]
MSDKFELVASFKPSGDQPQAIENLIEGLNQNKEHQVLQGVTGSGKTFTIANVISSVNRPALVLSHNKTLANQLYAELKQFFPNNRVEYFVSYFDYYKPEAYKVETDLYIEKQSTTNKTLQAMRMSALNALLIRRDTIVVASVASIYGAYSPIEYKENFLPIEVGMTIDKRELRYKLVHMGFSLNRDFIDRGEFKWIHGEMLEIAPAHHDEYNIRIEFEFDDIAKITYVDPLTKEVKQTLKHTTIYPATIYMLDKTQFQYWKPKLEQELQERIAYFESQGRIDLAQRIKARVLNDIEQFEQNAIVNGIENYARYLDGRQAGETPFTLFDYLPKDTVVFIDESHKMIGQLKGMYAGDYSRKKNLIDNGFRLPSAFDNRPLTFDEFEELKFQKIYISATPEEYELDKTDGEVVSQIIRPTGLLDPEIIVKTVESPIKDTAELIKEQVSKKERTMVLTTTKDEAKQLDLLYKEMGIKSAYVSDDVIPLKRVDILNRLRRGYYDVVIGIDLLKEGIDLPEVSLICVLGADIQGLFRSKTSLIQIVGRAARNDHGKVIFYANSITEPMRLTIEDNLRKREIQQKYNIENNIVPKTISKPIPPTIFSDSELEKLGLDWDMNDAMNKTLNFKEINRLKKKMINFAKERDYVSAENIKQFLIENRVDL